MARTAKKLLIVESPAKARTIGRYLGKDFDVMATMGHVRDLAKKDGVVRTDKGFETRYVTIKKKSEVLEKIRKKAEKASEIYLALDPDREGEAIAWHIVRELEDGPAPKKTALPRRRKYVFHRVVCHEITPKAVRAAIEKPTTIDLNKVASREARRILDRIVGFDTSELLWNKVKRGLSAGRVQTVALRLLVEREREIKAFHPKEYWKVTALLEHDGISFEAELIERRNERGEWEKLEIEDGAEAKRIVDDVRRKPFVAANVVASERRRNAAPPFITSTLEQEAARRLGYPIAETMRIAQRLYEGVDLGEEGPVGLITYMRTDSPRTADEAVAEARETIAREYGEAYLPDQPNRFRPRKGAQEAHEAIRPTSFARTPHHVAKFLSAREAKLYRLIWRRALASQMAPAVYDTVRIDFEVEPGYKFRATGSRLRFPGFLAAWEETAGEDEKDADLPAVQEGDVPKLRKIAPTQHFTEPPPRYSEAALVRELERLGIGRPSTYSSIIQTLKQRNYVRVDAKRLIPTDLGNVVVDLLAPAFPHVFEVGFTARMEDALDEIEEKGRDWQKVLAEFDDAFKEDLAHAEKTVANFKVGLDTKEVCPDCGAKMLLRWGRYGRFLACSNYPACKTTFEVDLDGGEVRKVERPTFDVACPRCGSEMEFKTSRFGAFLGCVKYPACKGTRPLRRLAERGWVLEELPEITETCPDCGGALSVKHSRFGRFLACERYPECRGTRPFTVDHKCPLCGKGRLAERQGRGGLYYTCTEYPACKFRATGDPVAESCPACGRTPTFRRKGKAGSRRVCGVKKCGYIVLEAEAAADEDTA